MLEISLKIILLFFIFFAFKIILLLLCSSISIYFLLDSIIRYACNYTVCYLLIFLFLLIQIAKAIDNETVVNKTVKIYNVDRAVCGRVAGVIAKKYGDTGFAGQLNLT